MSTRTSDISELSVAERLQMVEDIWDSIAAVPEAVPISEDQKRELESPVGSISPESTFRVSLGRSQGTNS